MTNRLVHTLRWHRLGILPCRTSWITMVSHRSCFIKQSHRLDVIVVALVGLPTVDQSEKTQLSIWGLRLVLFWSVGFKGSGIRA